MKRILISAVVLAAFAATPALAQGKTADGRPIDPAGMVSDTIPDGRPIDPAGIASRDVHPSDDPFGTARDLAGRPIRPDGISKDVAARPLDPSGISLR